MADRYQCCCCHLLTLLLASDIIGIPTSTSALGGVAADRWFGGACPQDVPGVRHGGLLSKVLSYDPPAMVTAAGDGAAEEVVPMANDLRKRSYRYAVLQPRMRQQQRDADAAQREEWCEAAHDHPAAGCHPPHSSSISRSPCCTMHRSPPGARKSGCS